MFRAVIKNAGLEDQSTIFILEICFSYQEIQVSRPSVNSVTQSTVSMRNGLPLHPTVKRGGTSAEERRPGRAGAPGGELPAAAPFWPQRRGTVPTDGATGAGAALGPAGEAAAAPPGPPYPGLDARRAPAQVRSGPRLLWRYLHHGNRSAGTGPEGFRLRWAGWERVISGQWT